MIYITSVISILIFFGLAAAKIIYYVPISDNAFLISAMIAFFLSVITVADIVADLIRGLIKYVKTQFKT